MKKSKLWSIIILFCLLTASFNVLAKEITIGVKGIVCAFCARGIEKTFKKQEAVQKVKVDLKTKIVTLEFKNKRDIPDATIKKLIEDAGYNTTYIKRN